MKNIGIENSRPRSFGPLDFVVTIGFTSPASELAFDVYDLSLR
jgi:hypothetical protein